MKSAFSSLVALLAVASAVGAVACTSASADESISDEESAVTGATYECSKSETSGKIGQSGGFPRVVAARAAGHAGFDRFVIELSGPGATFKVEETNSATFIQDASGDPQTVPGTAGLDVLVRGVDWTNSADFGTITVGDSKIMTKSTPGTLFEGDLTFGIGLKRQGCYHVSTLENPSRLVIDVQNDGAVPNFGSTAGLPGFQCGYPNEALGLQIPVSQPAASANVATKIVRKSFGAHPEAATPYDRFVLELTGGNVAPDAVLYPQKNASFATDGEQTYKLSGAAGLRLVTSGGIVTKGATKVAGVAGLSVLKEAEEVENFEGYSEWGIGLAKEACYRTFTLTDPPRIVVDVAR